MSRGEVRKGMIRRNEAKLDDTSKPRRVEATYLQPAQLLQLLLRLGLALELQARGERGGAAALLLLVGGERLRVRLVLRRAQPRRHLALHPGMVNYTFNIIRNVTDYRQRTRLPIFYMSPLSSLVTLSQNFANCRIICKLNKLDHKSFGPQL